MTMNRFDAARESLQRALVANPNAAYSRFLYGLSFYLTNDLQQALPQFVKARLANPKDARAALYLGLTYESLGRMAEALPLYQESARLESGSEALLAGARLLHLTGRLEEAGRWLQSALQRDPASRDVHFELSRLLLRNAKAVQAAEEGERALALPGGTVSDTQIHYLLSGAYRDNEPLRAARHAEAVKALENSGGR
jgi:tetratricopeptide (TPR) repeat protein